MKTLKIEYKYLIFGRKFTQDLDVSLSHFIEVINIWPVSRVLFKKLNWDGQKLEHNMFWSLNKMLRNGTVYKNIIKDNLEV